MPTPWACSACGAPGVKNLARRGYCARHLGAFVDKLALRTFDGVGVGVPAWWNPELLTCNLCAATWHGLPLEQCLWCVRAVEAMNQDQRRRLLYPDWAADPGDRYDELGEADKRVWDRTRGISRGEGSVAAWAKHLGQAVDAGIVTRDEANAALDRVEARRVR